MAAAAAYAIVVGALSLRTRGVYFIMVTLAFAQMAYFVVHDTKARRRQRRHLPVRQAGARDRRDDAARPRPARPVLLHRARRAGRDLRLHRPPARLALRPCARRHPRQRAAHARRRLLDDAVQARRLHRRRRARRPRRPAARGQGRRRQPRAAVVARVGRGAADADLRRHRQPARRGARRDRVHAAEGAVPVGGAARPARRRTGS